MKLTTGGRDERIRQKAQPPFSIFILVGAAGSGDPGFVAACFDRYHSLCITVFVRCGASPVKAPAVEFFVDAV